MKPQVARLEEIAAQLQRWLDWQKSRRLGDGLETTEATYVMTLPEPYWPTRGTLESWIATIKEVSEELDHD